MTLDYDRVFKLRLVVARTGEMDRMAWWNTKGILGPMGMVVHRKAPAQAGLLVLGDLSVQGNIKAAVWSLTEPLQVAMDNGARKMLVPV